MGRDKRAKSVLFDMVSSEAIQWLLANSGPSIRFQIIVDLLQDQDVGRVSSALADLLASPLVSEWISRLNPSFQMKQIHSSRPEAFENTMGKLGELGLRAGLQPFDGKTLPFRAWLTDTAEDEIEHPFHVFLRTIVASFLSFTGYSSTEPVYNMLTERLEAIHSFARSPDFAGVYVGKRGDDGLVDPLLYPDQQFVLPWIHDIRGFASSDRILSDADLRQKTETVVSMVLSPEYQDLQHGYGFMKYKDRGYKIGWSVHLPGFNFEPSDTSMPNVLLILPIMAPFKTARRSEWFIRMMEKLEACVTEYDTYQFPRHWLPEKQEGYWVNGAYMALEENRRKSSAIESESTFRMFRIKHLMEKFP
ncbi:MAG: hypothetical protein ACFFEX_13030 [Candidatus Thorarchaeota archaeon]